MHGYRKSTKNFPYTYHVGLTNEEMPKVLIKKSSACQDNYYKLNYFGHILTF